jgi:hypothetical protein
MFYLLVLSRKWGNGMIVHAYIYIYYGSFPHSPISPQAPVSLMMKRLQQHVEARRWLRTNMTSCALSVLHLTTVDPKLVVESRKLELYKLYCIYICI